MQGLVVLTALLLVTGTGMQNGEKYRTAILNPIVLPYFDKHPLISRPVYMDDTSPPYRPRAVVEFFCRRPYRFYHGQLAVRTLTPLNTCGTFLDMRFIKVFPPMYTVAELEAHSSQERAFTHNKQLRG